jgi:hypothetical protein
MEGIDHQNSSFDGAGGGASCNNKVSLRQSTVEKEECQLLLFCSMAIKWRLISSLDDDDKRKL